MSAECGVRIQRDRMESLVIELQKDILDDNVPTTNILRKALVVAKKLRIDDIEHWLLKEMNGYPLDEEMPPYRELRGQLKVKNPYQGWIPLFMEDTDDLDLLSKRSTHQSIPEIEELSGGDGNNLFMKFPPDVERQLMEMMEYAMEPALFIQKNQLKAIVEKTRNTVLDWALELERNGVLGEGMAFSTKEQEEAGGATFNIKNLIGTMNDSQIQQETNSSHQTFNKNLDLEALKAIIYELESRTKDLGLNEKESEILSSDLECIKNQISSPSPKAGIIKECLKSSRSIIEGATGSALFHGILTSINTFI